MAQNRINRPNLEFASILDFCFDWPKSIVFIISTLIIEIQFSHNYEWCLVILS